MTGSRRVRTRSQHPSADSLADGVGYAESDEQIRVVGIGPMIDLFEVGESNNRVCRSM